MKERNLRGGESESSASDALVPAGQERRRSFTESARRTQIIEEAVRAIAEVGYARASLGLIAQRLGVSKGVLSYHFTSREEMVEEIISITLARAEAFMTPRLEAAHGYRELLARYIEGVLAFIGSHRDWVVGLIEIYNARASDYSQHSTSFVAGLQELLEGGQRSGEFREFSPRVMATTIRAALEAVPHLLVAEPETDLDEYAHELVALFGAATATGPGGGS
jgi:TetR/AcrR family transcriptional regulator, fatty acid metabolism regulator protein